METSAQKQSLDRTFMELLGNIQSTMMTRHQKAEVMIAGEQLRYVIFAKLSPKWTFTQNDSYKPHQLTLARFNYILLDIETLFCYTVGNVLFFLFFFS